MMEIISEGVEARAQSGKGKHLKSDEGSLGGDKLQVMGGGGSPGKEKEKGKGNFSF